MSSRPTILKLGGSVVAPKVRPFKVDVKVIQRLAREIRKAEVSPLIVIHGGGGLPHYLAAKHGLMGGYKRPSQLLGFSKTHNAVLSLNKAMLDALIDQGLPAVSIQPSTCCLMRDGRISEVNSELIAKFMRRGLTPVLYGDVVLDLEQGFAVLSGDELLSRLALDLRAQRVVVGVDVDGLHTRDPNEYPDAELIRKITADKLEKSQIEVGGSRFVDVTGGMFRKISELLPVVKAGTPVFITNALKPGRVLRALKGEEVIGTLIHS